MRKPYLALLLAALLVANAGAAWSQGAGRGPRPQQGGNVPADFDTITTGITAATTQTQAAAQLCTTTICVVGTNATPGNGVALLQCKIAPQRQLVINTTSNAIQVYGSSTDTINGAATGTGVPQSGGISTEYVCTQGGTAAAWWGRVTSLGPPSVLLISTGSAMLIQTGSKFLIH